MSIAVQNTARDACSRKIHAVSKGYYEDPFVAYFATDHTLVNSPLMNRGHWLRVKAVEHALVNFAKMHSGGPINVVSLGAGMDTLYFRWSRNKKLCGSAEFAISKFLEVDLGPIVAEKRSAIHRAAELKELAESGVYTLAECDMSDTRAAAQLVATALTDATLPTFLLAECVFVYLDADTSSALLTTLLKGPLAQSKDVSIFSYDAMCPNDRFGAMMLHNLSELGIDMKGMRGLPSIEAHVERYKKVGFKTAKGKTMKALYLSVPREQQLALNKIEMIDDWDEWNLIHEHYCVVCASTTDEIPEIFPPVALPPGIIPIKPTPPKP